MSKEKILSIALIIVSFAFTIYFGYDNYQEKKRLEKDKAQDAMSIKQLQEQMKDALKNNQCANDFMPSNISDWMRNGKN